MGIVQNCITLMKGFNPLQMLTTVRCILYTICQIKCFANIKSF